jgi:hypothetical protein
MKTTTRILTFMLLCGAPLLADVPLRINYQGIVYDSNGSLINPSSASTRKVIFKIWDSATNGNLQWTEEQNVTIYNGEFSVLLGAGSDATGSEHGKPRPNLNTVFTGSNASRYLEIMVDNGSGAFDASDKAISPRQVIGTAAFAFHAQTAAALMDGLDFKLTDSNGIQKAGLGNYGAGKSWSGFEINGPVLYGTTGGILGTVDGSQNKSTALYWNNVGQVSIGTTSIPSGPKLVLQGDDSTGTASQLMIRGNTDTTERLLIGFDTTNNRSTLQSYTTSTAQGPLLLNPSGGLVGIGTTSPSTRLSVEGSISANSTGGHVFSGSSTTGLFSPASGSLSLNTEGNRRLNITSNGTVGIGIDSPISTAKLHVNGGNIQVNGGIIHSENTTDPRVTVSSGSLVNSHLGVATATGSFSSSAVAGDTVLQAASTSGKLHLQNGSGAAAITIASNGFVGVNTSTPLYRFTIAGDTAIENSNIFFGYDKCIFAKNSSGSYEAAFWPRDDDNSTAINYGSGGFAIRDTAYDTKMKVTQNGVVQIGTTGTAGRLCVGEKTGCANINSGAYFDGGGGFNVDEVATRDMSINAEGVIGCELLVAYSDVRIKTDLHVSDRAKDLETLMGIEITDYHYKDKLANTNGSQKKVIAQQVETVYPQAVSQISGLVPDLFKKAAVKDGWVELASDLKKGDRVKLIGKKAEAIHEVLEIRDGAFRPDGQVADEEVFVYGREVKDFRTVDYDAIAMLNVSATQELARKLQAENAALRHELAEQEKRATANSAVDEAQNARLVALEKLLTEKSGVPQTVSIKAGE